MNALVVTVENGCFFVSVLLWLMIEVALWVKCKSEDFGVSASWEDGVVYFQV